MRNIAISGFRLLGLLAITTAFALPAIGACGQLNITFAQIPVTELLLEGHDECVNITVTDRQFAGDFMATYEFVDGRLTSDIFVLSNLGAGDHMNICGASDLDTGKPTGCTQVGPVFTISEPNQPFVDVKIFDITTGQFYFAFMDSDGDNNEFVSDAVGFSFTRMPEPGSLALLGSGIVILTSSILRCKMKV